MILIHVIKRNSDEWKYMWDKLAKHVLNRGMENPTVCINAGETWQYMGTFEGKHEFRHRDHPKVKDRVYVRIRVSKKFNIEKDCEVISNQV